MGYKTTLGDVSLDGGHYGIAAPAVDFKPGLPAYLRITDISDDGTLNPSDRKSVDDSSAGNYLLHEGDIVFARTGNSTGRNYYYDPRDGEYAYAGFLIKFSLDPRKINPRYMKYYAQSKQYWDWVSSFNTGSTRGNINAKTYASMPIDLPSRQIQDAIVAICDAIDDKIRINRQLNDYLEQLCQSLFNRFDNDENNPFVKVSDIADVNPRRTLKKGEEALCIEMADLSTTGAFPTDWRTKAYNGGVKFVNGDTILARITPCLENGKAGYINFLEQDEVAFGSTEYIVLTSKGELPSEFFYFLARNEDFISYATAHMNGSSGRQRVSGSDVGNYEVRMPSEKQISEFRKIAGNAIRVISASSIESRKLAQLRDALLPKLMSGEIDASKVELTQLTNNHLAGRMHWSTVIRVRAIHAVHSRQSQIPAYESVPRVPRVPRVLHSHVTPP